MIDVKDSIERALERQRQSAASIYVEPANRRAYRCSAPGCERSAVSKGLCNGHYLRSAKGLPLDTPLRARKRGDACYECGALTGVKGGWGLCQKHYRRRRTAAIKDAAIAAMGGACARCSGVFHRAVFDFHHEGEKESDPSALLANGSPEDIATELARCVLLCANCHRLEHNDD